MKTTIEVSDPVYRHVKARAALKGQSVKVFLLEAIKEKLASEQRQGNRPGGWRAVFGKAPQKAIAELQKELDAEFSRINPEDWK